MRHLNKIDKSTRLIIMILYATIVLPFLFFLNVSVFKLEYAFKFAILLHHILILLVIFGSFIPYKWMMEKWQPKGVVIHRCRLFCYLTWQSFTGALIMQTL